MPAASAVTTPWTSSSKLRFAHSLFRKQGWLIVGSSTAPFAAYLIYLAGWSPYGLDLGSLGLSISAALGSFNIFGLRCYDLTPLAREHVFSCMRDAVLVLDMQKRLIDFNPVARELLPSISEDRLGEDASCLLPSLLALEQVLQEGGAPVTIALERNGRTEHFEIRAFAIRSRSRQIGWAAIVADVTAQVDLVRNLRHYAETDPLTGIGNRRRFFTALEKEFRRCERYGSTFSVLILDLDHFKAINDRYGHPAGDKVLCDVCKRVAQCLRAPDLLTRYGGEEFAILLPLTTVEGAFAVAERIRAAIADAPVEYEEEAIPASASIGVACYDNEVNPDLLLRKADRALYRAKEAGRNRVEAWLPEINRPQPAQTS
jgi:diguanylate cyclase (GGDEF)-like protein